MFFTVWVLKAMAAQLVIGFVAAMFTSSAQAIYWRRKILGSIWALTGVLFIVALVVDLVAKFLK